MRAGNTQIRTAGIMYLWTATIAFPVSVSAFAPLWFSAVFSGAMLAFTIYFSRGKSKSFRNLERADNG
jgi:UDP-GlcNAc:undecaprenyl-phosphate GlcNAc-1-phosphate transferase